MTITLSKIIRIDWNFHSLLARINLNRRKQFSSFPSQTYNCRILDICIEFWNLQLGEGSRPTELAPNRNSRTIHHRLNTARQITARQHGDPPEAVTNPTPRLAIRTRHISKKKMFRIVSRGRFEYFTNAHIFTIFGASKPCILQPRTLNATGTQRGAQIPERDRIRPPRWFSSFFFFFRYRRVRPRARTERIRRRLFRYLTGVRTCCVYAGCRSIRERVLNRRGRTARGLFLFGLASVQLGSARSFCFRFRRPRRRQR